MLISNACKPIASSLLIRTMATSTKYRISSLPLPSPSHTLTKNLTADPTAKSPREFRQLQEEAPSSQRRARLLNKAAHFSYVAPNPLPFPYHITAEEGDETPRNELIERWLKAREALNEQEQVQRPNGLRLCYPAEREQTRELIGLSETGLRDCLPHLDVGDALDLLGTPRLAQETGTEEHAETDNPARRELIDVLSGHATLMNIDEDLKTSWAPWSLRYSGHQFGNWAGQLGDGRAISVCTYIFRI
jgi:serine/tyrosine/threonine adenylyltransferase